MLHLAPKRVYWVWEPFGNAVLNLCDPYNGPLTDNVVYAHYGGTVNGDKNCTDTSRRFHVTIRPFKIRY
jgi:hypothetical protein